MANDTYALLSYTMQDKFGTKTQTVVPVYVDQATIGLNGLRDQWVATGNDLDTITDAQIIGGRINIEFPAEGGWKDTPGSGSFVERTGVFNFFNNATKYKFGVKVPSFDESKLSGGKINLSDTDVAAFITLLTTVFTHGEYVNPGLHLLTVLADAFLAARKYRRQLDRSTYEV